MLIFSDKMAMTQRENSIPKKIKTKVIEWLKIKSADYLEKEFTTPSEKEIEKWVQKKLPTKYWSSIKSLIKSFRRRLPSVSQQITDGRKSYKRNKTLGQTFASPSWISADLGKL